MQRRFSLVWLSAILFLSAFGCTVAHLTHGPAVSEVESSRAILWVRLSGNAQLHARLQLAAGEAGDFAPRVLQTRALAQNDYTARFDLKGLLPGLRYDYQIQIGGSHESVTGSFRTAPAADDARPLRFVFGGDIAGQNICRDALQGLPIFQVMGERRPDFFVALGDLIYADSPCLPVGAFGNHQAAGHQKAAETLDEFRAVWRYVRADPVYRQFLKNVPSYAIWDDHEVVNDFGPKAGAAEQSRRDALIQAGARAFVEYHPVRAGSNDSFFRTFRYGRHAELFLLDTRSQRDPNAGADSDDAPKTMLGAAQRKKFEQSLLASRATWKFVVSSVPISIPTGTRAELLGRDGWAGDKTPTGFERELRGLLQTFAASGVRNIVFLVTDVHFASVLRYQPFGGNKFAFHEFVTGPLNAGLFPTKDLDPTFRPERLFFYGPQPGQHPKDWMSARRWFNFGEVVIGKDGALLLKIVNGLGDVVFEKRLAAQ